MFRKQNQQEAKHEIAHLLFYYLIQIQVLRCHLHEMIEFHHSLLIFFQMAKLNGSRIPGIIIMCRKCMQSVKFCIAITWYECSLKIG